MNEVLNYYENEINNSQIINILNLNKEEYFLLSIHREENTDDISKLISIFSSFEEISHRYKMPVIIPLHPRTKNRLLDTNSMEKFSKINFIEPLGFFDYTFLQKNSYCTISDSGTISEESSLLNFPALTLRRSIERPEALENSVITLTNGEFSDLKEKIDYVVQNLKSKDQFLRSIPDGYLIKNTSERVINLILSTSKISNYWLNRDTICRSDWD